jgi:transposase
MLTQEEYVNDVLALRRQGLTIAEIAAQIGYHPATVSKWLRAGGPPAQREVAPSQRVIDQRWQARIAELVAPPSKLLATSVFVVLAAEGFDGSYPSVARAVRALRGPRFRPAAAASVPIETAPGEECQFDWSDCSSFTEAWGLGEVWCFGAILCWSRWRWWWFAPSIDREHTFEALVSFFEAAGGVTRLARTDRMGALGVSQGRRFRLHPPALDFARHHGTEIVACQAGDAARKGKIERPFRDLKETFLEELAVLGPPADLVELNARGAAFLETRVHPRAHSTTGVAPAERLETERRLLGPLPRARFDTAYREPRRVHPRLPLVEWDATPYSVPPECLGQAVEARVEVGAETLEIRWGARVVARHRLAPPGSPPVWDSAHRAAAEAEALGRARRANLRVVPEAALAPASPAEVLGLPVGDWDVGAPDLARYGCGCDGAGA